MNGRPLTIIAACVTMLTALASADFELFWHTIDGGGGTSAGGDSELSGTIGQPDAGAMSGGEFTLLSGFWSGAGEVVAPSACSADLNDDATVNVFDMLILLGAWGQCHAPPGDCPADLNNDASINVFDLLILLGAWGPC